MSREKRLYPYDVGAMIGSQFDGDREVVIVRVLVVAI